MHKEDFDETNYVSFLILVKSNEIWEKVKNSIKKVCNSESVCNEKYLEAKTKSCNGRINTDFHNNKIPKEGFQFIFLLVILIDSLYRILYSSVLKECKYVLDKKNV